MQLSFEKAQDDLKEIALKGELRYTQILIVMSLKRQLLFWKKHNGLSTSYSPWAAFHHI